MPSIQSKRPWTHDERLCLLACINHCCQHKLDVKENIAKVFRYTGHQRILQGIIKQLRLIQGTSNFWEAFQLNGSAAAITFQRTPEDEIIITNIEKEITARTLQAETSVSTQVRIPPSCLSEASPEIGRTDDSPSTTPPRSWNITPLGTDTPARSAEVSNISINVSGHRSENNATTIPRVESLQDAINSASQAQSEEELMRNVHGGFDLLLKMAQGSPVTTLDEKRRKLTVDATEGATAKPDQPSTGPLELAMTRSLPLPPAPTRPRRTPAQPARRPTRPTLHSTSAILPAQSASTLENDSALPEMRAGIAELLYRTTHHTQVSGPANQTADNGMTELEQRTKAAESRCKELQSSLHHAEAKNQVLQSQLNEMQMTLRSLETPDHAEMRKRFNQLKLEEAILQSTRSANSETLKLEQTKRRHLERQSNDKIKNLEEEAYLRERMYSEQLADKTTHNERLRRDLRAVRHTLLISRQHNGEYPPQYDDGVLHSKWATSIPTLVDLVADYRHEGANTTVRQDSSLPAIVSFIRTVVGLQATLNHSFRIEDLFNQSVTEPTDYSLALACLMARAVEWCFRTSFHADGTECSKMQNVWETIATHHGLKMVVEIDRLTTLRKISDKYFRESEIPQLADQQMAIFKQEFSKFLPLHSADTESKLTSWLADVMLLKLDLLVSKAHHKIAFILPGTPFDGTWMRATADHGGGTVLEQASQYQVQLCLSPALIANVLEPDLPDVESSRHYPEQFQDALLESRNFFPEEPGQWKDWPGSRLASPAWVIVEKIPRSRHK